MTKSMTTYANSEVMFAFSFPDVMMPSYAKSKWYAVFFILYIITVLYVLMNLVSCFA